ncbi:MAG TPA: VOC family protein [Candidatus Saccharimonadales bacterium]|nr:VOC family protein [Candidatus Saccharimonadales bacterium]
MNPVTWFSIPSDDVEKAAAFYNQAFGWDMLPDIREKNPDYDFKIALNSPSNDDYVAKERGRVNGCIIKRATGIKHPVVLVEVDSLEAAGRKIEAAGGKIVSEVIPMDSLNGKFFLATDVDGNMIEIFKNN